MKQNMPKPFYPNPFLLIFYLLPKIPKNGDHFQNKTSLMKPDTFDFKSLSDFLLQLYPLHDFIISPHMLLNWKTQKTVSAWRSSRLNEAERNITHLNLS